MCDVLGHDDVARGCSKRCESGLGPAGGLRELHDQPFRAADVAELEGDVPEAQPVGRRVLRPGVVGGSVEFVSSSLA